MYNERILEIQEYLENIERNFFVTSIVQNVVTFSSDIGGRNTPW